MRETDSISALRPYVPNLVVDWLADGPSRSHRQVRGTLAFVDISGFTALTERLARKGHVGAEEMSDALNVTFGHLIEVAQRDGADLVKWGGDAVLLLFSGDEHAARACRAAHGMRARLREVGTLHTSAGIIKLRMSVGVHSGDIDFFLVGDPALHRELLLAGHAVTQTVRLEGLAEAGQVVVSDDTARLLPADVLGARVSTEGAAGHLLRRAPHLPVGPQPSRDGQVRGNLREVLPTAIRDHLLAGRGAPEHRRVAVAFVHFGGTDTLLAAEGPEVTAQALDAFIRSVSHAAASHGVTFFETDISMDGGKVMLVAGAPRTAGHDADRMLRAARRILDDAGRLPLRIGVNIGRVFSGDFGPPLRRTYSVKGDAINLAARVLGKAADGELLATRAAFDHAETRFEATPVGPFTVKGKTHPVHALSVGAVVGAPSRTIGHLAGRTELIGRRQELARLVEVLTELRAGRGSVAQLVGEPGIGKSRLLDEVVAIARSTGDVVVRSVVCDEYLSATPYAAFRDVLRDALGVTDQMTPDVALATITERVGEDPALTPWLPLLGGVLDVSLPRVAAIAELDDQFRKARLESVVVAVLDRLLPTAMLLAVDDAHWIDAASADLLDRVAQRTTMRPWVVLAGRRDVPTGWRPAADVGIVDVRVLPLSPEAAMSLAMSVAGDHSLPRPALAALAAKADGNPLFVESLVGQRGAAGVVDHVPTSIEEVVSAQVDRLGPSQRLVLRHASVLGTQFPLRDLADLLPPLDVSLAEHLGNGLADFLVPVGGQEPSLRFRHGLVRDVAYEGLAFGTRRRLHDQVGLRLERDDPEDHQELLSFHFLHAGRYDKAWLHARAAGEQALSLYANIEAAELLGRAVEAARRLPRGAVPGHEIALTLETLGDCWFTIGSTDEATAAFRQARRHVVEDDVLRARLTAKEAMVEQRLRRFPQAMRRLSRALGALDGRSGSRVHSARSGLQVRYAISRVSQGRMADAITWGTRAVQEAERSADPHALAPAYATLHGILLAAGRAGHREMGLRALAAYVDLDDLSGQAQCTNNLAVGALEDAQWPEAVEEFGRAADLYRRIGDTDNEGVATCNLAEVLVNQGRWDEATALLEEALRIAHSVADDELVALALRQLGRARARSGNPAEGLDMLTRARGLFVQIDADDEALRTDLPLAEARLLGDDLDGAIGLTEGLLANEDAADLVPEIRALRGFAELRRRRFEEGELEFRTGLASVGEATVGFGVAMCCQGLAVVVPAEAAHWTRRSHHVLEQLGVVAWPAGALGQPVT